MRAPGFGLFVQFGASRSWGRTIGWWRNLFGHWWLSFELFLNLVDYALLDIRSKVCKKASINDNLLDQCLQRGAQSRPMVEVLVEVFVQNFMGDHICDDCCHERDGRVLRSIWECTTSCFENVADGLFDQNFGLASHLLTLGSLDSWFHAYLDFSLNFSIIYNYMDDKDFCSRWRGTGPVFAFSSMLIIMDHFLKEFAQVFRSDPPVAQQAWQPVVVTPQFIIIWKELLLTGRAYLSLQLPGVCNSVWSGQGNLFVGLLHSSAKDGISDFAEETDYPVSIDEF